jgi:SSS family solute:Na+ symporter
VNAHPLDIAILGLHLSVMLGFGVYFYFRVQGFDEYYDGGRVWGAWLVSLAVASANIGAANTIGAVTLAYTEGPSAFWYVTLQALAFIPFAYLAVPKIYPRKETTLAEFLENRYRPWLRPVSAGALGLATMAILPAQIVGGASVIVSLIGIDYTTAFVSVGAALILYTALGGLPSVTYNDTYQWSVIVLGFAVGVPLIVADGGGISAMLGSLPESHRSWWFGGSGGWSFFTIAAWSITVLIARFGSQEWYQRTRAARSADAARRGFIGGGLMAAPFGVLTMLIGVAALELYPNLANPNEAFARTMMDSIPTGFRALMMSAILAAVVSSGESSVNAATALLVNDVMKPYWLRGRSDRFYLRLSQVGCVVLGATALTLAVVSPGIIEYIRLGFLIRTPVAIIVIVGLYWPAATATGAAAGIVVGTSAVLAWQTLGDPRAVDPFWIATPVTLAALVIGSRFGRSVPAAEPGIAS